MPDYGVDTPDWSPLPWSWAAAKLAAGRNYWVVTASADARPHALPVWGVWDDDDHQLRLVVRATVAQGRQLAANPQVTSPSTTRSSACRSRAGRARRGSARQDVWIERYLAKYTPLAPDLSADFLRQNLLFELVPERALAVIEREEEFADPARPAGASDQVLRRLRPAERDRGASETATVVAG